VDRGDARWGTSQLIRSTAGTFESPVGPVVAIASEHDAAAGTRRGPNTIFVLSLGGLRVCHLGEYGQRALRPEQGEAIGRPDLLFVPVGGGATVGAADAATLVARLAARCVVPMHYRTDAINFLEPVDLFLARFPPGQVVRLARAEFETGDLPAGADAPLVVVPASP